MELEQYELAIEEQAYPFEEKAIDIHESNLKLIFRGVYNVWIEKSLQKLAEFVPARYDKPEETSGIISSLETYIFEIERPAPPVPPESKPEAPAKVKDPGSITDAETLESTQVEESESVGESETAEPEKVEEPGSVAESESKEPAKVEDPGPVTDPEPVESTQVDEPAEAEESVQIEQSIDTRKHTQR